MRAEDVLAMRLDVSRVQPREAAAELLAFQRVAAGALGVNPPPELLAALSAAGRPPPNTGIVEIVLLDSTDANAFVLRAHGRVSVAVTKSVPFLVRALFLAALAERQVFQGLDDVHYLRDPFNPVRSCDWTGLVDLVDEFDLPAFVAWSATVPPLPRRPDFSGRGDFAHVLAHQASMFFAFHECGHVAMQHLVESPDRPGIASYAEFESVHPGGAAIEPTSVDLLRHANELEADRFATERTYVGFYRDIEGLPPSSPNRKAMLTMSERSRSRIYFVTMGLVFVLLQLIGRAGSSRTHPRPSFRLREFMSFCRETAARIPKLDIADVDLAARDAIADLSFIGDKLGLDDPFATRPDDYAYAAQMATVRSVKTRQFND
jgi:hypothetical protein